MTSILPNSASAFSIAIDDSTKPEGRVAASIPQIRLQKLVTRPASVVPFLIYEFGLDPLRPVFSDLYQLIDKGRQWERYRGTHKAIHDGLGFVGYDATIIDPPSRRIAWADFQLHLDRLRDDEDDLFDIDRIVSLSQPMRSDLRRVYYGLDIPAVEGGWTTHGNAIWGDDSGTRIAGSDVKWSFGRRHEITGQLLEAALTELDIWIPPVSSNLWVDNDNLWADSDYLWANPAEQSRRSTIGGTFAALPAWMRFENSSEELIGFRKAQTVAVRSDPDGLIEFDGTQYAPNAANPTHVFAYAHTGFGDGDGETSASVSLLVGGTVPDKPGKLWRTDVSGGTQIAPQALSIEFGKTVRDRVQLLLEIT